MTQTNLCFSVFIGSIVGLLLTSPVFAQATANAIDNAEDAFGTRDGDEAIGIYSENSVRGFDLEAAGNYRINGHYFVKSSGVSRFFVEQTNVRIGYNTMSLDFPGPSGVVDYNLRAGGINVLNELTLGVVAFNQPIAELLVNYNNDDNSFSASIGAGVSFTGENRQGAEGNDKILAGIVHFSPTDATNFKFFGGEFHYEQQSGFKVLLGPNSTHAPSTIPRRIYLGQDWAVTDGASRIAGILAETELGGGWRLSTNAVFSENDIPTSFTQFFTTLNDTGSVQNSVLASPSQRFRAYSGEASVAWRNTIWGAHHDVSLNARLRRSENMFGGDTIIDLGETILGVPANQTSIPDFTGSSAQLNDKINQWGLGLSYQAIIGDDLRINLGLLKTSYEKTFLNSVLATSDKTTTSPWLYNIGAAYQITSGFQIYGSYSRGLEEAGVAPTSAANANAVLPASIAVQKEIGFRVVVAPNLNLLFAGFETEKPLPGIDPSTNEFRLVGNVRHRGLELSLAGSISDELSIVAGGALIDATASGPDIDAGLIGTDPVSVPKLRLIANATYTPSWVAGLSFDVGVQYAGTRAAQGRLLPDGSQIDLPGYGLIDVGFRYKIQIRSQDVTLRAQIKNLANVFAWTVNSAETLDYQPPRAFRFVLTSEF